MRKINGYKVSSKKKFKDSDFSEGSRWVFSDGSNGLIVIIEFTDDRKILYTNEANKRFYKVTIDRFLDQFSKIVEGSTRQDEE